MLGKSGAHTQFGPGTGAPPRYPEGHVDGAPGVTPEQDEFALIEALRARFEEAGAQLREDDLGIGDDAAVVRLGDQGRVVLATDLVVAGVHVDLATSTPEDVGWKALMVAVSDVGAMGCRPSLVLLSVAAPQGFPIERLADGVAEAAAMAGCSVVGGDLSSAPVLVVSVTAVGPGPDGPPLRRDGARAGDRLFVTGPLGASAAGLRLLSGADRSTVPSALAAAHRRPVARLSEGIVARTAGATAAIDVSDGLLADSTHLAVASGVGLDLTIGNEVVADGATRLEALNGGEDYELVLASSRPDELRAAFAAEGLRPPIELGRCTDRPGERLVDGAPIPDGGWRHRF
jgi:thiamine-monophosphate kinase